MISITFTGILADITKYRFEQQVTAVLAQFEYNKSANDYQKLLNNRK